MGGALAVHELLSSPEARKEGAEVFNKFARTMGAEFQKSKAGQSLWKIVQEDYLPAMDKARTELGKKNILPKGQSGPQKPSWMIDNEAKHVASDMAFGKNHELIAAHLAAAAKEVGDTNAPHVKNLADNMAMILHDNTVKPEFKGKKVVAYNKVSEVKYDALHDKQYGKFLTKFFSSDQVYTPRSKNERIVYEFAHTTLAPLAAIGHLGTFANAAFSVPFRDLNKALIDVATNYQATKQMLQTSGVMEEDILNTIKQQVDYRSGTIAKYTNGTFADYFNRAVHMPGLRGVRNLQTVMFGSAGYHTAIDMAAELAQNPSNARALYELRDMHLDPREIIAQGGKLSEEQIQTAIWHYTNNHVFLHTDVERSFYARQNGFTRQASMFHSFTSAQGRFIFHEMQKAWSLKGSDPMLGVRSIVALLGVFPAMGFAVKQIEQIGRGEGTDIETSYDNIRGENGKRAQLEEYLSDYSYVGGFGIAGSYIRGASRNTLGNMIAGPLANAIGRTLFVDPYRFYKTGDIKPELRDLITYSLPDNLGKIITHTALPTKAEKNKGKMHSLHMKGMKGLSMND